MPGSLELEKRVRRAVDDVMAGGINFTAAVKNRGVPDGRLRQTLKAAGWRSRIVNPGPRRRSFGNGRRHGR